MPLSVKLIIAGPSNSLMESIKSQTIKPHIGSFGNIEKENISQHYNTEYLLSPRHDIYGFMSGDDIFTDPSALETIVKTFEKDMKFTGVVYSDKLLNRDGINICQIYPPYSQSDQTIFNPTIFVNGHINSHIFDENLVNLRNYDVVRRLGTVSKVIHIPKFLIQSKFTTTDIKSELDKYVGKSS